MRLILSWVVLLAAPWMGEAAWRDTALAAKLLPEPRELVVGDGALALSGRTLAADLPVGPEHEACRAVLGAAVQRAGGSLATGRSVDGCTFRLGKGAPLPELPTKGIVGEAYVLAVTPDGVAAHAASPIGLLWAAETLMQLARIGVVEGTIPAVTVRDSPEFRLRGIYIEGGQERFGRIVHPDYLKAQVQRLASLKMNTLMVEAYNLFPYASFPACADSGSLSAEECRGIFAEARKWHVTLVPSLQTLAQAYELVWTQAAGEPYREATAPGLICPSNPNVYPFIKGLYRDLLTWFADAPLLGIGCSEIDMQWQSRYCPKCKARVEKGETVRGLLLGHAEKCIQAVDELAKEMGRPVRPLMWSDEFYMYGPGRDWVGIERIPRHVVMGFWKYWPDYAGIAGLMDRGYDVLGISAMYNHCFYLADLSPANPPKSWPSMEATGVINIAGLVADAAVARRAHPDREFLGVATASFSKHRLRAFDSLWLGFALNAQCLWSRSERPYGEYPREFLRAYVRHTYDTRTEAANEAVAAAWERLDAVKSSQELANQALHDVVGVVDTQEAGYLGNTVRGAWQKAGELLTPSGEPLPALNGILGSTHENVKETASVITLLNEHSATVGDGFELANLRLAAEKIRSHAQRQVLLIESRCAVARAGAMPESDARRTLGRLAAQWKAHEAEVSDILRRVAALTTQGDPIGFSAILGDVRAIDQHLAGLAARGLASSNAASAKVLVDERFTSADTAMWEILGSPRITNGVMETSAPGGWGKLSGVLSRRAFPLDARRPLVVEFDLTPITTGLDSQLVAAADQPTDISFRFAMACSGKRFSVHTQSSKKLPGGWIDPSPGWRQRSVSPEITAGEKYQVRAEVTRTSWRVLLRRNADGPWDMPFWDTGKVPMDELLQTRLLFADVEPEGSHGGTRWGPVRISR